MAKFAVNIISHKIHLTDCHYFKNGNKDNWILYNSYDKAYNYLDDQNRRCEPCCKCKPDSCR